MKGRKTKSAPSSTGWTVVIPVRSPDYNYSDANKNSGITWNEATFKEYIKDPRAKIPNTKMIFPGIKNEKEAGDLWAYLKEFGAGRQKKVGSAATVTRRDGQVGRLTLVKAARETTDR